MLERDLPTHMLSRRRMSSNVLLNPTDKLLHKKLISKVFYRLCQTILMLRQDSEYHEKLSIRHAEQFNRIFAFKNIWEISFAYCSVLPKDLHLLTEIACLGFVDVSFTNINFYHVQSVFRKIHIIRFNCFGNDILETGDFNTNRGFLIHVMPRVWVVNGVYITLSERNKWFTFFSSANGAKTEIFSKWKYDEHEFAVKSKNCNSIGHRYLTFPVFQMGGEADKWKIDLLIKDMNTSIRVQTSCNEDQEKKMISLNIILLLLLLASIFPHFPKFLLHDLLKLFFNSVIPQWSDFDCCPLNLSFKDRVIFAGITLARLQIDNSSSISQALTTFFTSDWIFDFTPRVIHVAIKSLYPSPEVASDFDFCNEQLCQGLKTIECIENELLELDIISTSRMNLLILELLCLTTHERLFLAHAQPFQELCLSNGRRLLVQDQYEKVICEKDLRNNQDWDSVPEGMKISSRAIEVKTQLVLWIRSLDNCFQRGDESIQHKPSSNPHFLFLPSIKC